MISERKTDDGQAEDLASFNKRFKYAVVAFAIVEFIVTVAAIYYKTYR